jgi:hypothetical protein
VFNSTESEFMTVLIRQFRNTQLKRSSFATWLNHDKSTAFSQLIVRPLVLKKWVDGDRACPAVVGFHIGEKLVTL